METGVLERIRALEADVEKRVDSVVQQELFRGDIEDARHCILLDSFKAQQVEEIRQTADKLLDLYLDDDDIVNAQEAPAEGQETVMAAIKQFEARIADIREYHQTYRDLPSIKSELILPNPKQLDVLFSVRERYGACFDMEPSYNLYSTFMTTTSSLATDCGSGLISGSLAEDLARWGGTWELRVEYFRFIPQVPEIVLHSVHAYRKVIGFQLYKKFVSGLLDYLVSFYTRVHPLQKNLTRLMNETEKDAEAFWSVLEAERNDVIVASLTSRQANSDADPQREENEVAITTTHGQKLSCGLVVPPPLKRFFKTFSLWPLVYIEQVISSSSATAINEEIAAHEGNGTVLVDATAVHAPKSMDEVKGVCIMEAKIASVLQSILFQTLTTTEQTLLRDYSRTTEELEMDRERAEKEFEFSLEKVRRNVASTMEGTVAHAAQYHTQVDLGPSREVKKAEAAAEAHMESRVTEFLGDDDQPVARWLVRLQQLDKNYLCEVCGSTVYKGPQRFREHFGGERHTEGLRRLGVTTNLREYEGIASIRMAIQMRNTLSGGSVDLRKRLREDFENEETQDVQGKVVTSKDYTRYQRSRQ